MNLEEALEKEYPHGCRVVCVRRVSTAENKKDYTWACNMVNQPREIPGEIFTCSHGYGVTALESVLVCEENLPHNRKLAEKRNATVRIRHRTQEEIDAEAEKLFDEF